MNVYRCPGCGYVYDEEKGDAHEGLAPGTTVQSIAAHSCPDCGVRDFVDFAPAAAPEFSS